MSFSRLRRQIISNKSGVNSSRVFPKPNNGKYMDNNDLEKYNKFIGIENGNSLIVCGCGVSLNDFIPDDKSILFGVNDVNRKINTKYLLCVNEPFTFKRGRFEWIANHTSEYLFTHLRSLEINNHETLVYFQLGERDGYAIDNIGRIDYTANSPYMAAIIAYQMGASKIALIGVDLTQHHFFAETGDHLLTNRSEIVNEEYKKLGDALISKGVKIANLSPISKITSWPNMTHEQFNNL